MDGKKELLRPNVEQAKPNFELGKNVEVQPEVESWMEKIERKFARVPNQTQDLNDDSVVIQPTQSGQPPVTLPVNQTQMVIGKKGKVTEGIAWLVAWVVRQIKMLHRVGRKVRLSDMPEAR